MRDFSEPLLLKLHFSKRFTSFVILLHSGTLLVLLPLTFPSVVQELLFKLSLALLIIANLIHTLHYHVFLHGHPLYQCQLYRDQILTMEKTEAQLLPSYVHPQLVILRAQLANRKTCVLVILPDALDETTFRHLRIHVKHADLLERQR